MFHSLLCFKNKKGETPRRENRLQTLLQKFNAVIEVKTGDKRDLVRILLDSGSNKTFIKIVIAKSTRLKVKSQEEFFKNTFSGTGKETHLIYDIF